MEDSLARYQMIALLHIAGQCWELWILEPEFSGNKELQIKGRCNKPESAQGWARRVRVSVKHPREKGESRFASVLELAYVHRELVKGQGTT